MATFNLGTTKDRAASDTRNGPVFNWLMVTGATGSVVLLQDTGDTITLASVPVGVWVPVGPSTNITTASTATGFMVV